MTDPRSAESGWRGAAAMLVLGALLCLAYGGVEVYLLGGELGLPLDDSWIHLQFASRLAAGDGLAFNPGVKVTGSTAPLWTALLALVFVLPGNPLLWAKLFGVAAYLAGVDASRRLGLALGLGAGSSLLAAGMVMTSHWLVWSALSAMEISLFTALSLWGIVLHLRERAQPVAPRRSLVVLAAAALARPEGFLLLLLACGDGLLGWRREDEGLRMGLAGWRRLAAGLGLAALVLLPTLLFYRLVGGSFLPTTFMVKGSGMDDLLPNGRYLAVVLQVLFRSQPLLLLFAGAGTLRLVADLGGPRDRGLLPALWLFGLPVAYAFLAPEGSSINVGNFGRYYFPLLPVVAVLGVLGVAPAFGVLRSVRAGRLRLPLGAVLVAVLFLPQLVSLGSGPLRYARNVANVHDSDVATARWLAPRLSPQALLAVQDIGALKYLLPNPVVDLVGIVNPEILAYVRASEATAGASWEHRLFDYLETRKPDYLVVFPEHYPRLTTSPGFHRLQTFPVAENTTMAGDELAIFATPWTRHPLGAP